MALALRWPSVVKSQLTVEVPALAERVNSEETQRPPLLRVVGCWETLSQQHSPWDCPGPRWLLFHSS